MVETADPGIGGVPFHERLLEQFAKGLPSGPPVMGADGGSMLLLGSVAGTVGDAPLTVQVIEK